MTRIGGHDRPRSWDPMGAGDLVGLRLLADAAARIEGDALARLEAVAIDDLGELVAWAWVLDTDRTHVLMIDHHRWGVWMAPGGRVEPGEDPLEAAARELFEETGANGVPDTTTPALVDAIARFDPDGRPVTTFGVAFAFQADREKALSPEPDQPARWWPLDDPPERRSPHLWQWMSEHLTRPREAGKHDHHRVHCNSVRSGSERGAEPRATHGSSTGVGVGTEGQMRTP